MVGEVVRRRGRSRTCNRGRGRPCRGGERVDKRGMWEKFSDSRNEL